MSDAALGRREHCEDRLDPLLAARIAATLDRPAPGVGDALPGLWHWAFFQTPAPGAQLSPDGHPLTGDFLPAAPGRPRMWAGSRVWFHQPLHVGTPARRDSEIIAVNEKQGRSGALLFVTLRHRYLQHGALAIEEEQDIVYRRPSAPVAGTPTPLADADWAAHHQPQPPLLMRYAGVTFNAHRIHYDLPYATAEEGYAGLVVQGPLMATLMLQAFTDAHPQAQPTFLQFRGLRPLIAGRPMRSGGRLLAPGEAEIFTDNDHGPIQVGRLHFLENP
ncbi:itaconyl-CoA hydratase [Isoalcanivorax beigongshangi]|uniref:Itaconyl-CoA hydratase n=1 Tax=Isoalcanivorax beigongshangi TaxID=3238810 RepID=A0ABV4AI06_9GAMM